MVRFELAVPADVRFGAGRVSEVPQALTRLGASRVLVVTGRDAVAGGSGPGGADRGGRLQRRVRGRGRAVDRPGAGRRGAADRSRLRCRPRIRRRQRAGCRQGGRRAGHRGHRPAGTSRGHRCRPPDRGAGPALRRRADHGGDGFGGDPQLRAVRRRSEGEPAEPADAAEGGRGRPRPAGRPARGRPSRPAGWMRSPSSSSRCCPGAPTRSAMRWPGTGSAAPPGHCAGPGRRECRTPGFAKTWPSPACSAGCAWPIPGWAPSMALRPRPVPGSPRRTVRSAPPCSPRRWRSTCARCVTEPPSIPRCRDWPRWRPCSPAGRTPARPTAIAWLQELTAALSIPGLASYGLDQADIPAVVTAAQQASSMRGNPIELTDAEVTEIVTRAL